MQLSQDDLPSFTTEQLAELNTQVNEVVRTKVGPTLKDRLTESLAEPLRKLARRHKWETTLLSAVSFVCGFLFCAYALRK